MNITRREAVKRSTLTIVGVRFAYLAAVSGAAVESAGCDVFNDILNWVPVGEAALNSMITVLTSNGIVIPLPVQTTIATIEAGFTALTGAINTYKSANPAPVGAEAKVQEALIAVVTNFKTFLAGLNVPGTIFNVISGLAQVVLSTIAAFENQLPAAPTATAAAKHTVIVGDSFHVGGVTVAVVPKKRGRLAFKRDFNSVLDQAVKQHVVVPKSAYHHIPWYEHLVP